VEQQLRFNTGKPKLSYFYSNARALERLQEYYAQEEEFGVVPDVFEAYDSIFEDVALFLSEGPDTGFRHLVRAFQGLAAALEYDLGGDAIAMPEEPLELLLRIPRAVDAYCDVCVAGEAKYPRGNFRKGAPITDYLDSMLRHLRARLRGEHFDLETGKPTGAHSLWNLWQALDQPGFRDNRLPAVVDNAPTQPSPWAMSGIPVPVKEPPSDEDINGMFKLHPPILPMRKLELCGVAA
jgi:hypothetical protein